MSNARIIRRPSRPDKAAGEKRSRGRAKWIVGLLIVLGLAVAAWAFFPSTDPALAQIEQLRAQMEGASPDQRRELFGQLREAFENLRPESRDQLRDSWRDRWQAREQQFLNEFFALTPAEQIAKLDEQIDEEERRRQERAQRSDDGNRRRGPRGRGGDRNSLERRKSYLDRTPALTRAQRSEYRRLREERRRERGLPESRRWW